MHVIEISWMFVMENCTVEFICISAKLLFDLYWLDESHLSFVALIRVLQNSIFHLDFTVKCYTLSLLHIRSYYLLNLLKMVFLNFLNSEIMVK